MIKGDESEPNVLNPKPNQCIVYDWTDYVGDYTIIELPEGSTEYLWDAEEHGWNERMSSWRCGTDIMYYFCYSKHTSGSDCRNNAPWDGESGVGGWNNPRMGHTDWVSEVWLYPYSDWDNPAIVFYDNLDCTEASHFVRGYSSGEATDFTRDDLYYQFGYPRDSAASVQIPLGVTLQLWDSASMSGDLGKWYGYNS